MDKTGKIIITSNVNKKNLLKKNNNQLLNVKVYSITEFNKLFILIMMKKPSSI